MKKNLNENSEKNEKDCENEMTQVGLEPTTFVST